MSSRPYVKEAQLAQVFLEADTVFLLVINGNRGTSSSVAMPIGINAKNLALLNDQLRGQLEVYERMQVEAEKKELEAVKPHG